MVDFQNAAEQLVRTESCQGYNVVIVYQTDDVALNLIKIAVTSVSSRSV